MFKKVLIANRGEIARRVLRCLDKLGVDTVAVYHALDRKAPWVTNAGQAVEVTGATPTQAYLDVEQIVGICKRLDVDAVHPGYGFLSENAAFADAVAGAGIAFIGPSTDALQLMGDKLTSRQFVADLGYPVPPSVSLSADDPQFAAAVAALGFPVVVKASAGGGGKGMSIVHSADELEAAVRVAASEAQQYFGDDRIYVERYFTNTRHIEVQVVGDGERAVHFGERECSIQRRFQKVIEEAPSPVVDAEKRNELGAVAVGIAQAAKYSSAGTVEFLFTQEGEFYFLEMNTRIQVEHPVTEMVYGVDLIQMQIEIAAGEKLDIDQTDIQPTGHAVEARVCAEDPTNDFLPETGRVHFLKRPDLPGLRIDDGLYAQQEVSTAFDSMLAKVVGYGADRETAIANAVAGLQDLVVLGVHTNAQYLVEILRHADFVAGNTDTGFIDRHGDIAERVSDIDCVVPLATAYLADRQTQLTMERTPALYLAIGAWRN